MTKPAIQVEIICGVAAFAEEEQNMVNIEWDCVRPLKMGTEVDVLEVRYLFKLPADLKECIKEHNGGIPFPYTFDFGQNKGKVFGGLLSFNEGDADSFYDVVSRFETPDKKLTMFPFGVDPAGNLLCVKDDKIVFYYTETEESFFISKTFTDFLDMLYE